VDHPATQQLKRERLRHCGIAESDDVHFVAADLSEETLQSALARSSFDPAQPAFFSWLGVTVYLTREANLATLRAIATVRRRGANWSSPTSTKRRCSPAMRAPRGSGSSAAMCLPSARHSFRASIRRRSMRCCWRPASC
jgi:methyltransferase (TIGR00027 family)